MDEPEQAGGHQRYLTNGEQQVHGDTPDGRVAARLMPWSDGTTVLQDHRKGKRPRRSAG